MELKYGKGKGKGKGKPTQKGVGPMGLSGTYTTQELHAKMAPKFEKIDRDARELEIANALKAMESWERKHARMSQR